MATLKYHIKYRGKALCGRKKVKNPLRFTPSEESFDFLDDEKQCKACKKVTER